MLNSVFDSSYYSLIVKKIRLQFIIQKKIWPSIRYPVNPHPGPHKCDEIHWNSSVGILIIVVRHLRLMHITFKDVETL